MNHPSEQHPGGEPIPPALERELASLTAPRESSGQLADKAWELAQAGAEPKVFVLRRWLAPMAVAATLVVVGLAVTSLRAPLRSVPDVASGPTAGKPLTDGDLAYRLNKGIEKSPSELVLSPELSTSNSATLEQRALSGGRQRDRADDVVDKSATAPGAPASGEPAPATPRADERGYGRSAGQKEEAPASKDAAADESGKSKRKSEAAESAPQPAAEASKPSRPPAPKEEAADRGALKQDAPPPEEAKNAPAPGPVPVPGGSTAASRAESQFDAKPWHTDDAKAGAAGTEGERANTLGRDVTGGSVGAPAPTSAPGPIATTGFAYRVFVLGKWWWIGIAAAIVLIFALWRRRLARLDREPAPDQ